MATKLSKPVQREVKLKDIFGVEGNVVVTMSAGGVTLHKGKRKLPVIPWASIAKLAQLPLNIPAKFSGNPVGWLVELSRKKPK